MVRSWIRRIGKAAVPTAAVIVLLWAVALLWTRLAPPLDAQMMLAIAIVALALLAAIWWLWWRLPERQVARLTLWETKARADVEDNFRKTVGQALGGAAVLIGAVAAYLQFTQQQRASYDLLISNQASKGFEQLAGKKTAMRLGGIYALEGVMNTSEQYHQPVLEALCAFVRDSSTRREGLLMALSEALFAAPPRSGTAGKGNDKPPNDIQAALTVIGRRKPGPGDVNLVGASISGANLEDADLRDARLSDADLENANLGDANLNDANLSKTNLRGANLKGAKLQGAILSGASLFHANLDTSFLGPVDLSKAILTNVDLRGASLFRADLSRGIAMDADLRGGFCQVWRQRNEF
jgi:hypothetical protein